MKPEHWQAVLLGLALAIASLALPAPSRAEGPITVTATRYENRFPAQLKFEITLQSVSPITRLTLRHRLANDKTLGSSNVEFSPGQEVSGQYVWNTQRRYIPPGVELQYYWQIENETGDQLQTPPITIVADDTRFEWQSVSDGELKLFWYHGDVRFAEELLAAGTRALKQLGDEVGVELDKPAKIFIYATQQDLLGALPPRGMEWTGGQAFPEAGIVALTAEPTASGRQFGVRTVPHELSHLIVHRATDNPFAGVPRWLDEGLAMYAEGELPGQFETALRQAVTKGGLLSLRSLSGNFPTDADKSLLGYAESHSVVKYMLTTYGRESMSRLLGAFREGSTAEDAVRQAYSRDLDALENEWRARIGAKARAAALPPATIAAAPEPTKTATEPTAATADTSPPVAEPKSQRSCFAGLLGFAGSLAAMLFLAVRLRG